MIDPPEIVHTQARAAAVIHVRVARAQMQAVFGPAIEEIMGTLAGQGLAPAGPVFAHHLRMAPDTFDFEVGVPVEGPVTAAGRVKPGELPAARVARTVYRGGYEGLPAAWSAFMVWIEEEGYEAGEDLWECYVTGPGSDDDPSTWRTELNRPLR